MGFDEVRRVAAPAMAHRLVLDYSARLEGWDGARVVAAWEGTHGGVRLSDHAAVIVDVPALRSTTCAVADDAPAPPHTTPTTPPLVPA